VSSRDTLKGLICNWDFPLDNSPDNRIIEQAPTHQFFFSNFKSLNWRNLLSNLELVQQFTKSHREGAQDAVVPGMKEAMEIGGEKEGGHNVAHMWKQDPLKLYAISKHQATRYSCFAWRLWANKPG
jgi:hypothetical protein